VTKGICRICSMIWSTMLASAEEEPERKNRLRRRPSVGLHENPQSYGGRDLFRLGIVIGYIFCRSLRIEASRSLYKVLQTQSLMTVRDPSLPRAPETLSLPP